MATQLNPAEPMRTRVDVSPEMLSYVGAGPIDASAWPAGAIGIGFALAEAGQPARLHFAAAPHPAAFDSDEIVLIVTADACRRVFGRLPDADRAFHMPPSLRTLALEIRDSALPEPWRNTLRLAKSIELLSETFRLLAEERLISTGNCGQLSEADCRRILAARRIIEERWSEKLTLSAVARSAGLNRAKLTRGFRELFQCSVVDALTEQRLRAARQMLLATDLPVSAIGYRCGYLNNASFTRAFSRRFGTAPSQLRACGGTI